MPLSYDEARSSIPVPTSGLDSDRAGKVRGEIFRRIIDHGNLLLDCPSILKGISKMPLEIWIEIFKYVYLSDGLLWPRPQDDHFIPQSSDDRYHFEPRIYDGARREIMPTAFGLVINHHIYSSIEFAFESFEECFSFLVGVPIHVRSRIRRIVLRPYLCSGSFAYEYFHQKDWLNAHRQYVSAGMIDEKDAELNSVSCHIMQLLEASQQFERLTFQVFSPDLEWSPGDTEITKEDRVETFISGASSSVAAVQYTPVPYRSGLSWWRTIRFVRRCGRASIYSTAVQHSRYQGYTHIAMPAEKTAETENPQCQMAYGYPVRDP